MKPSELFSPDSDPNYNSLSISNFNKSKDDQPYIRSLINKEDIKEKDFNDDINIIENFEFSKSHNLAKSKISDLSNSQSQSNSQSHGSKSHYSGSSSNSKNIRTKYSDTDAFEKMVQEKKSKKLT